MSQITDKNEKSMPTVALALGSGGARGCAHIGVIRALEKRGYKISAVSGCSMGAIVGGFYCAGKLDELTDWIASLSYLDILKLVDVSLLSSSVIRGDKVFKRLSELLDGQRIESCNIPFTAVATDMKFKKEIWFQQGIMEEALRASSAIPTVLSPVVSNNRLLVDGGLLNPLPITPCVAAHTDVIIAVDLNAEVPVPNEKQSNHSEKHAVSEKDKERIKHDEQEQRKEWYEGLIEGAAQWIDTKLSGNTSKKSVTQQAVTDDLSKLDMLNQMFEVMQSSLAQFKVAGYPPDLLIRIPRDVCQIHEFHRASELIELGYQITIDALNAFEQGHSSLYGQKRV